MIIAAAIKHEGVVYPGRRHHDCIRTIQMIFDQKVKSFPDQGFIDGHGNYLGRWEAGRHAIKCGQIKELYYDRQKKELYSEDLY